MISICMAYYNRPQLLRNSLWAYCHLYKDIKDYEFVIVDDGSDEGMEASRIVSEFKGRMNINCVTRNKTQGNNPAIPINISVKMAAGDIIVIQNPECVPINGVLGQISMQELHCDSFEVIPCYSIGSNDQKIINGFDPTQPDFLTRITDTVAISNQPMTVEGDGGWYEHPIILPRYYYFMAGMKKETFLAIGGIDEEFSYGVAFEDDDFKRRLIDNKIPIYHIFNGLCMHQNHYKESMTHPSTLEGWNRNAMLYQRKAEEHSLVANVGREWGKI